MSVQQKLREISQEINLLKKEELLNKEGRQTEEEKTVLNDEILEQMLEPLEQTSVEFSKVTDQDYQRADGLNLKHKIVRFDFHLPDDVPNPCGEALHQQVNKLQYTWREYDKMRHQMTIDIVLTQVLSSQENLSGHCQRNYEWHGPGFSYTGKLDYLIGPSHINSPESLLLVSNVGVDLQYLITPKVVCQVGCLLKTRLEAGKSAPVLAVATNGESYQFIAMERDYTIHVSEMYWIRRGISDVSNILKWFDWFISIIKSLSPGVDGQPSSQIEAQSNRIKNCFKSK